MRIKATYAERLLVDRRRRGESQEEAAARHGVTVYRYRLMEDGDSPTMLRPKVGRIKDFEACFLLRRREGLLARAVAGELGVSRAWVSAMERGSRSPKSLIAFWKARLESAPQPV